MSRSSQDALSSIIQSDCSAYLLHIVVLITEFGNKNCNRMVRQTCMSLLKLALENRLEAHTVNDILEISSEFIKNSISDPCNVVRQTARSVIDHLRTNHEKSFSFFFESENINTTEPKVKVYGTNNMQNNFVQSKPKPLIVAKSTKSGSLGKARRVKIMP